MNVYIAAPYELRELATAISHAVASRGHFITSRWLIEDDENNPETAEKDLTDIVKADAFLLINPESWAYKGTGGRHVEFGFALAFPKKMFVLGVRSNLFHHHKFVKVITDLEEFI